MTKGGLCTHRKKMIMLTIELVVCSLLNPPYIDFSFKGTMLNGSYEYYFNDLIVVITLCKSYLILRVFEHYSIWTSSDVY